MIAEPGCQTISGAQKWLIVASSLYIFLLVGWKVCQIKLQREIKYKLPEFSTSKIFHWVCHEDTNTLRKNASYDLIIGGDLLSELGIEINFNTQQIVWEGVQIPMKEKHIVSDLQNAAAIYYQSIKPTVLKEAGRSKTETQFRCRL